MGAHSHPSPEIRECVERLFCSEDAPYGNYRPLRSEHGVEVLKDTLFRFTLTTSDHQKVNLQLYKGLNSVGGALWSREVRALMRVSTRRHPALPVVLGGDYDEEADVAFILTEAASYRLDDPGARGVIGQDKVEALRQLTLLAHGLSLLHEQGITHRNLHPGCIEYVALGTPIEGEPPRFALRLSRFEMSTMISNLVRRQLSGEHLEVGDIRNLYLQEADQSLAYASPERVRWLFKNDPAGAFENDRTDVYALGVLAWRWLVEAHTPEQAAYKGDAEAWAALEGSVSSHRKHHDHLVRRLRDGRLLRPLSELLRKMLAWEAKDRPSVFEVLSDLTDNYGRYAASFTEPDENRTFYLGFMPTECVERCIEYGWIQPSEGAEGLELVRAFLEEELSSPELLHAPEGFNLVYKARDADQERRYRQARHVLVGRQAFWFCDLFRQPGASWDPDRSGVPQLMLIRYFRHHHRAWRINETPLRRRIPGEIQFVPVQVGAAMDLNEIKAEGCDWRELARSVEFERRTPPWMIRMDAALRFLLDFRRIEVEARTFPFNAASADQRGDVTLTWDRLRDRRRMFRDPLRTLYFSHLREPMGSLFQGLQEEGSLLLHVFADQGGRPDFRSKPASVVFSQSLDHENIVVRASITRALPPKGWIRPADDEGTRRLLLQQEDALVELRQARGLLHQLHNPIAIRGIRRRWAGVGDHLRGRSAEIVKDMLASEPLYALHGPPGTGKTTVASEAVTAHLTNDESQRLLISSQSHHALDNLAIRILDRAKERNLDVLAVRFASDSAVAEGKVDDVMMQHRPRQLARDRVEDIQRRCERALEHSRLPDGTSLDDQPALKALLAEWRQLVPRVEPELRARIRRGANLVFATTGGCTARNVGTAGTYGVYDWVIVEEAARAWPTELAMPLVRGLRWTLIGDHFQLPAFDELSVAGFLDLCHDHPDEEIRAHGESKQGYLAVYHLFGTLFDRRAQRRAANKRTTRLVEPLDELDLQFRMREPIARLVSKTFYRERIDPRTGRLVRPKDGWLKTDRELTDRDHGLTRPSFLKGRSLVWLDTEDVPDSASSSGNNPGEAKLIGQLLAQIGASPTDPDSGEPLSLAVLSPYRRQKETLEGNVPGWATSALHTVDSFQGREADIVIVSLVRSVHRSDESPQKNIGFLISPHRVNVLLSRARRLLIIVGRFQHFVAQAIQFPERQDVQFWKTLTDVIKDEDARIDGSALGKGGTW